MTQVSSTSAGLDPLVCPDMIAPTSQTRNLDAFVNCAADSHISPKRDSYLSPQSHSEHSPTEGDTYNSRYQHAMLPPSSDGVIAAPMPQNHSTGKNMIMSSGSPAYEALVTSVAKQMLSAPEQMDTSPSTRSLSSLLRVSESSPTSKPETKSETSAQNDAFNVKTEEASEPKSSTVPLTVKEISGGGQKIGDMVLPPGPAPPLTGMVPQEMVKMTDNDLISYINPSCFDQGGWHI